MQSENYSVRIRKKLITKGRWDSYRIISIHGDRIFQNPNKTASATTEMKVIAYSLET